jgi:FkbM family methyltransferase
MPASNFRQQCVEGFQRTLARSDRLAHLAHRTANVLLGVVYWNLGHDARQEVNGEADLIRYWAPSSPTCVDVGANKGEWSQRVLNSNPAAVLHLFEPSLSAQSFLEQRFANQPHVHLHSVALGDHAGNHVFYEEKHAGETSSLLARVSDPAASEREVVVARLDDTLESQFVQHVDFLKVDAEGFDLFVLRGAEKMLAEGRISVIQFEYNEFWRVAGATIGDAFDLLEGHDYVVSLLHRRGLRHVTPRDFGDFYHYANFVAVSRDAHSALTAAAPPGWTAALRR